MTNVARINGLSPYRYLSGAMYTGGANLYAIPTTDTTASYAIGDIVQSAGGCDSDGIPFVQKIPAASASLFVPLGVIVGIRVVDPGVSLVGQPTTLEQTYILSGSRTINRYVFVADDPNLTFAAYIGSGGTQLQYGRRNYAIGSYYSGADQIYTISQNTYLSQNAPYSNVVLVSQATTNTLPIQGMGFIQTPDQVIDNTASADGAYVRMQVRFNYHEFGFANTGTGNFTGI